MTVDYIREPLEKLKQKPLEETIMKEKEADTILTKADYNHSNSVTEQN